MLSRLGIILLCGLYIFDVVDAGSWWYLGTLSINGKLNGGRAKRGQRCENLQFLTSHQQDLCKKTHSPDVIGHGAAIGIEECQQQFSDRRWNCSVFNTTTVFGRLLDKNSREKAYVYAIMSSGVMHIVTRSCARGEMIKCGCDAEIRHKDTKGKFEWGGCSHDTVYSEHFTKDFVDTVENGSAVGLMNKWNNQAGRQAVKKSQRLVCKCHGVSGSCSVKICWRMVSDFALVGAFLKNKFDGASHVRPNKHQSKLKPIQHTMRKPKKADLVYLEHSPDFCETNVQTGSLGTHGRECNKTSVGMDSCLLMCCGRGYYTIEREIVEDCDCQFEWCCRVVCQKCKKKMQFHYCN